MYEVFVWVPSRGWKLLLRTKSRVKAVERALEFTPLEVKLTTPSGRNYHSGTLHCPSTGDVPNLSQIERYRDEMADYPVHSS